MLTALLILAFAASMLGGLTPAAEGFLERLGMARILSFRSGLLIAVALGEAFPEAWNASPAAAVASALGALGLGWALHHSHDEEHGGHELTHPHIHGPADAALPTTLAALFAHSLIDGLNLGAIALVGGPALLAVGVATSLHKLADGFTLTSLFSETSHSRARVLALLVAGSLMTPLGALLGREGAIQLGPLLTGLLLGFAAGSFVFVGACQIVPRLRQKRDAASALAFGVGLTVMFLLTRLGV